MKKKPIIIADQAIPHVTELFHEIGDVTLLDNNQIINTNLSHADALLVRSVTQINKALLTNTPVKFVGSMTAGIDHLDTPWLQKAGISWAHAPGANAQAVAQYVICTLALLQQQALLPSKNLTIGLIGAGHVGQALNKLLTAIGIKIILIDPPRAEKEESFISAAVSQLKKADLISIHTPLIKQGAHPTYQLINNFFLQNLKPNCVLINSARGEVAATDALLNSNQTVLCLDVFANEPNINTKLVEKSFLTTPHIAGYSLQAKYRATEMILKKLSAFFQLPTKKTLPQANQTLLELPNASTWQEVVLACYNPLSDSIKLKEKTEEFASLRNHYSFRNEFNAFKIKAPNLKAEDKHILENLGFT